MADIYDIIDYSRQSPTTITEEKYSNVGTSFTLGAVKRAFLGTGFQLRDTPSGAPLTLDTDYELDEVDNLYSGSGYEDEPVYTKVNILNVAYETGDLYVTYNAVATYVTHAANILHSKLYGKEVGELFAVAGNIKASAQFDDSAPTSAFFGLCLDDIDDDEVHDIDAANYPDLVTWARAQKLKYLEGQTGEAESFAGSASGSVITLTDTTANNAVLSALYEDALAHGGGLEVASYTNWLSVTWDGTEYPITAINTTARTITVTGTPTAGAGDASFYPHRIPASATTARLFSMQGRSLTGAGMSSLFSGLRRRDQMQGHWHRKYGLITNTGNNVPYDISERTSAGTGDKTPADPSAYTAWTDGTVQQSVSDGTNGTPRTGSETHSPDSGVHIYIHAGRYLE